MQDSDEKRIAHLLFVGDFIAIVTSSAGDGKNSTGKRRDVSSRTSQVREETFLLAGTSRQFPKALEVLVPHAMFSCLVTLDSNPTHEVIVGDVAQQNAPIWCKNRV